MEHLDFLIKKYEAHIEQCEKLAMEETMNAAFGLLDDIVIFKKVLLDLYKIKAGLEPKTDLTYKWNPNEWNEWQN